MKEAAESELISAASVHLYIFLIPFPIYFFVFKDVIFLQFLY